MRILTICKDDILLIYLSLEQQYLELTIETFFIIIQVWIQKCAVQKASVDVNISYY